MKHESESNQIQSNRIQIAKNESNPIESNPNQLKRIRIQSNRIHFQNIPNAGFDIGFGFDQIRIQGFDFGFGGFGFGCRIRTTLAWTFINYELFEFLSVKKQIFLEL